MTDKQDSKQAFFTRTAMTQKGENTETDWQRETETERERERERDRQTTDREQDCKGRERDREGRTHRKTETDRQDRERDRRRWTDRTTDRQRARAGRETENERLHRLTSSKKKRSWLGIMWVTRWPIRVPVASLKSQWRKVLRSTRGKSGKKETSPSYLLPLIPSPTSAFEPRRSYEEGTGFRLFRLWLINKKG